MSKIIPFSFEKLSVRVVTGDSGEPLFVGKDICDALGYADHVNALKQHCRGVVKRHPIPDALGRMQETRVIEEPDMMRLVVNSQLPSAQAFEKLVFETILPTVRKTGAYLPDGVTFDSLPPSIASQIGGIIKAIVIKQLDAVLEDRLPLLVAGKLANSQIGVRYGETAGEAWYRHGLETLKNGSIFLSGNLVADGCSIDGCGCVQMGRSKAKLFDPDKVDRAMKDGLLARCKRYIQERNGQGNLFPKK